MYENGAKRLCELKNLAEIIEECIRKPDRATGTCTCTAQTRALKCGVQAIYSVACIYKNERDKFAEILKLYYSCNELQGLFKVYL